MSLSHLFSSQRDVVAANESQDRSGNEGKAHFYTAESQDRTKGEAGDREGKNKLGSGPRGHTCAASPSRLDEQGGACQGRDSSAATATGAAGAGAATAAAGAASNEASLASTQLSIFSFFSLRRTSTSSLDGPLACLMEKKSSVSGTKKSLYEPMQTLSSMPDSAMNADGGRGASNVLTVRRRKGGRTRAGRPSVGWSW